MLFNSHLFLAFFVGVSALYWLARRSTGAQNALLLIASYVFYATWDWRFCSLLAISTLADFTIGRLLCRTESEGSRKRLLRLSAALKRVAAQSPHAHILLDGPVSVPSADLGNVDHVTLGGARRYTRRLVEGLRRSRVNTEAASVLHSGTDRT